MRRNLQILGWTLVWSGLFTFGYLGWQLLGTNVVNQGVQAAAEENLMVSFQQAAPPRVDEVDTTVYFGDEQPPEDHEKPLPENIQHVREEAPTLGNEFAFLRIPKIALDEVLFEGVGPQTLKKGPGHMPGTALPGQPGNAVISGHRTTYGAPFWDLDLLEPGDLIEVETTIGVHVYEVRELQIVDPTDVWVTNDRPGGWLTLTTCTPKGSARQRLIIFAELVSGPNQQLIELDKAAGLGPSA